MNKLLLSAAAVISLSAFSCGQAVEQYDDAVPASADIESTEGTAEEVTLPEELPTEPPASPMQKKLDSMSLHDKICQMFIVTPESLTGYDCLTEYDDWLDQCYDAYPVGGFIFFDQNISYYNQTAAMLDNIKAMSSEKGTGAFLSVDEEGGDITRVQWNLGFEPVDTMRTYGDINDYSTTYNAAAYIGSYLAELGFNLDFAPVADVEISPYNELGSRIFSTDPKVVADVSKAYIDGMHSQGILTSVKHFPGLGAGDGNTHYESVFIDRTADELRSAEFPAFSGGIEAGADFFMVGHQITSGTGDGLPADLSPVAVNGWLRSELGFKGLAITDSHSMCAITDNYSSADSAVLAVEAGMDMILMPYDIADAVSGLENAVYSGRITPDRIDESVLKILEKKDESGLIS